MSFNFANMLEELSKQTGEKIACSTLEKNVSFAELNNMADQAALFLKESGVQQNDVVAIVLPNSVEWIAVFFGAFKLKAIPLGVHFRFTTQETEHALRLSNAKTVITDTQRWDVVFQAALSAGVSKCLNIEKLHTVNVSIKCKTVPSNSDLYFALTGGTTGFSKIVKWTQNSLFYAALNQTRGGKEFTSAKQIVEEEIAPSGDQLRVALLGNLAHSGSQWTLGSVLVGGGTICLYLEEKFKPEEVCSLASKTKAQVLPLMGDAMAVPLCDYLMENPHEWDMSSVFVIHNGAAPLSSNSVALLKQVFSNCMFFDTLGSSECGIVGSRNLGSEEFDGENICLLVDGVKSLKENEVGDIAKKGFTSDGYLSINVEKAFDSSIIDGQQWTLTGDFGTIKDGKIKLLGRGSSVINSGGEKIYPLEVEEILKTHDDIEDAAVVGLPHERWGTQCVALIVEKNATDPDDLKKFLSNYITSFKIPKHFIGVQQIAKTVVGKTNHLAMTDLAQKFLNFKAEEDVETLN